MLPAMVSSSPEVILLTSFVLRGAGQEASVGFRHIGHPVLANRPPIRYAMRFRHTPVTSQGNPEHGT
jgi:hypothetical protein